MNLTAKKYYDKAISLKSEISSTLQLVAQYTQEFGTIDDSPSQSNSKRVVDPDILDSIDSLQNFMMFTLFGIKTPWIKLGVNSTALKKRFDATISEREISNRKKLAETSTEAIFGFLFESNCYVEISKMIRDAINLGTGCIKTIPLPSTVQPFTYRYVSLNNLYIFEDSFGKPNYIFKVYHEMNEREIVDNWGRGAIIPPSLVIDEVDPNEKVDDPDRTATLIESVIPVYNEEKGTYTYQYIVFTDDFQHEVINKTLTYNPYTVFRFSVIPGSSWGKGIGMMALDSFERLAYYKSMRYEQVQKIINPPLGYRGDKELMYKLSTEAGSQNYLGDDGNLNVEVNTMGITPNLLPLDQDIMTLKQNIRDLYIAKPFGDINEVGEGAKSTSEVNKRFELFRTRYSGTAELAFEELLKPLFVTAYQILIDNKMLESSDMMDYAQFTYVNQLTKASKMENVYKKVQFMQILLQNFPKYAKFVFKPADIIYDMAEDMEIQLDLLNEKDKINKDYAQEQAQMQALAMSQLGAARDDGVDTTPIENELGGAGDVQSINEG